MRLEFNQMRLILIYGIAGAARSNSIIIKGFTLSGS